MKKLKSSQGPTEGCRAIDNIDNNPSFNLHLKLNMLAAETYHW
jgi:hypothetical protein